MLMWFGMSIILPMLISCLIRVLYIDRYLFWSGIFLFLPTEEVIISENSTYSVQLLMMICEKKMKANQYHTKDVLTALCYTFLHIYLNNNSNSSNNNDNRIFFK